MELGNRFVLGHYQLMTTDIRALMKQLRFWTFASIKGAMIMGEKRVGKTYTIRFLLRNLEKVLGTDCYAISLVWKPMKQVNEKRFWRRFLRASGYNTSLPGDADVLEERLLKRIQLSCEQAGVPVCFIAIDEAQNMTPDDCALLCYLFNQIEEMNIRLYTLLFGQHELEHLKTLMEQSDQGQVIARFMQHSFVMNGVTTASGLKSLLSQIDKMGITAEELCQSPDDAFKLAGMASTLWAAKTQLHKDRGEPASTPWTMQTFHSVVAVILQHLGKRDPETEPMTQDDLYQIINLIGTRAPARADDD